MFLSQRLIVLFRQRHWLSIKSVSFASPFDWQFITITLNLHKSAYQ